MRMLACDRLLEAEGHATQPGPILEHEGALPGLKAGGPKAGAHKRHRTRGSHRILLHLQLGYSSAAGGRSGRRPRQGALADHPGRGASQQGSQHSHRCYRGRPWRACITLVPRRKSSPLSRQTVAGLPKKPH
eukprot:scaffold85436_cov57-Phaeocystis_antarctica.AAC.1